MKMSDKNPGWDVEGLKETKKWAIAMVLALNNCLIAIDEEPIKIILEGE